MTTTDQLAAIEARADAATEGPWHVDGEPYEAKYIITYTSGSGVVVGTYITDLVETDEDAEFIAHARTDVPALLALVREQAAKLETVERWTAKFEASQSSDIAKRENAQFDLGYSAGRRSAGSILRAALTATEGD